MNGGGLSGSANWVTNPATRDFDLGGFAITNVSNLLTLPIDEDLDMGGFDVTNAGNLLTTTIAADLNMGGFDVTNAGNLYTKDTDIDLEDHKVEGVSSLYLTNSLSPSEDTQLYVDAYGHLCYKRGTSVFPIAGANRNFMTNTDELLYEDNVWKIRWNTTSNQPQVMRLAAAPTSAWGWTYTFEHGTTSLTSTGSRGFAVNTWEYLNSATEDTDFGGQNHGNRWYCTLQRTSSSSTAKGYIFNITVSLPDSWGLFHIDQIDVE